MQYHITNARLVLADQVMDQASLLIEDGQITAINPSAVKAAQSIDLGNRYLLPGMIDLHADALEKDIEPRPNVHFPLEFAIAQADKRNAAAGITTVFHSLSFANAELGLRNNAMAADIVRAIHAFNGKGLVDNRVHTRYEITDPTALPVLLELLDEDSVHLLSIMDHTPGQGQFKDMRAYQDYLQKSYQKTAAETQAIIDDKLAQAEAAQIRVKQLIAHAHAKNVHVASHDDDCPDKVAEIKALGVHISEFPINLETARYAIEHGMRTIMGAPNILRGKSQSGSMKAQDAIEHGVASCLCSDYAPASLLAAVFLLEQRGVLSLPEAVQLVSLNPAQALGLADRGEIAVGKRADLVCVDFVEAYPQTRQTWVNGQPVYQALYGGA
ncbi:MAG: alpha-D-ribose 1-methylphosphonate 5-triphosphate diphosphatase [Methylococcaceae bacterium]|nr:alpha-D-ribose 1-methylphosphonate 5-triphosphate diphosphatase [Methylococcaceae bacterium]MDP3018802.1 alpha-D-ribose 1-methylphosphonate 5-triphosphate diphosphatase [Methylococcaceae bacterium]MDP3391364.1 alpha-D-ribose 1-methylphosphonate 5-triphosphate diphosphatase [Methylococcaceae bacterium]MDP3933345.1 alpha-D-ribose 1-methylphosphonate 5-triphosphate diphosphatase [Methylococcaceae bacterium]MDZ4218581.1 alpha-D-ribose 1-methylphosphonate 5-triphosphate diphosphatase [Methylobact